MVWRKRMTKENELHKKLTKMTENVMCCYHEEMHEFLNSVEPGTITDADVILMIMNMTISVGTNIYYSIKQILPTTVIDFDFSKVKIVNSFADSLEKIKDFNPKENTMPLTVEQVKEVVEKGFVVIAMPDGTQRKVTEKDILVKKEDIEKIIENAKKESVNDNTGKLIIP